ncbi:hypothetical protein FPV67DRAFT_1444457 [Lyophyllum atratum]|nr:hypothetical protein FPV67DRAFT_1444457 [Lyophyllum atratum]
MSTTEPERGLEVTASAQEGVQRVDDQIEVTSGTENGETCNVIDADENVSSSSISSPEQPLLSVVLPLSDLALHSPSSQIVGTPFTTESRFEYPFPDSSSSPSDAPSPSSSVILTPGFPSVCTSASFPSSSSQSLTLSSSPPSMTSPFPPTFPLPANLPTYSSTHPKMRAGDPPVPPGLVKKRQRWSLGLLRRRSSNSSQTSEGSPRSAPPPLSPSSNGAREGRVSSDPRSRQATVMEEGAGPPPPPHTGG